MNRPCARILPPAKYLNGADCAAPRSAGEEGREENAPYSSSSLSTAMNASVGSCTEPRERIFFLPPQKRLRLFWGPILFHARDE